MCQRPLFTRNCEHRPVAIVKTRAMLCLISCILPEQACPNVWELPCCKLSDCEGYRRGGGVVIHMGSTTREALLHTTHGNMCGLQDVLKLTKTLHTTHTTQKTTHHLVWDDSPHLDCSPLANPDCHLSQAPAPTCHPLLQWAPHPVCGLHQLAQGAPLHVVPSKVPADSRHCVWWWWCVVVVVVCSGGGVS